MKKKTKIMIITIVFIVVLMVVLPFVLGSDTANYSFRTETVRQGELELTVTASGNIQPVTKVSVGTQVSGIVKKLYVDFNSQVKAGQLLAELDKSTLSERVRQANATFENSKSDEKLALQNYNRIKLLYDQKAETLAALEEAENKMATAKGKVVTAKADYQQALVNLSYADIYSPISGRVLDRAVDEGQTVAASFSTPTLFTIANDLTKMQVEANVDEADIGQIKVGQHANFNVDTYPGETFSGKVSQVRLEPIVTSNVVTYTVIVEAPNPDEKLYPGMTANITITTQSPQGMIVSAEALYFTPDPQLLKNYIIEESTVSGNKIWIKTMDGLKAVGVISGASDGVETIILSGIKAGETIVSGIEKITNNDKQTASASIMPKRPKNAGATRQMMN